MTQGSLTYGIDGGHGSTVVRLEGVLDFHAHPVFRTLLGELDTPSQTGPVVFDLGGLTSIDPAGLGLLLIARRRLRNRGLTLRRPSPDVDHVLALTGFAAMVPISA